MWEWIQAIWADIETIAPKVSGALWGWGPDFLGGISLLVILLLGTGILLSIMTGFVQFTKLRNAIGLVMGGAFKKDDGKETGDITPFQALMTSLSATVGNGNIAGVATAIAVGGPGATFWMWITALFGMATKYAEAVLGVEHRVVKEDGTIGAGPMYYCEKGIGGGLGKALGVMFAACGVLATLIGTGNMFQTNSMAVSAYDQFGIPQWITGLVIAGLVGAVILGGIKRIGAVAERLVPSMIGIYFLGAIAIILYNITEVPAAIALIVESAFSPSAALGGVIGITIQQAIRFGVSRGILSNESGLGTAPIAHGAAKTDDPVKQGQIAMIGTFIDTIIVCSLTAIAITVTGAYKMGPLFVAEGQSLQGINMTMHAFNSVIPFGGAIVTIGSFLFGFSTLLGWCYYGEKCLEYLFGIRVRKVYQVIFILFMFMGALPSPESISTVVIIGDIGNALMAIPNLFALLFLAKKVGEITRRAR